MTQADAAPAMIPSVEAGTVPSPVATGAQGAVIVGGGPAGRAALACLPGARLITRPALAWHAEPGRLWVEDAGGVRAEPFTVLLLCADEPLLLAALRCGFDGGRPVVNGNGATTVPGVYAAGRVLGAATAEVAVAQARRAAAAAQANAIQAGGAAAGAITAGRAVAGDTADPASQQLAAAALERLDPVELAGLLEQPPGPARNAAVLAQCALLGPVLPARPVSLAALAALTPDRPVPRPVQDDEGTL